MAGLQSSSLHLPAVSIVIPVYHDARALARALADVAGCDRAEVIVAATAEDRDALRELRRAYPNVQWVEAPRGRARQMNAGAARATAKWLLFLHADTVLGPGWAGAIDDADRDSAAAIGCFRFALDSRRRIARLIEAGVALRVRLLRMPYGDQALFLRRELFEQLGGYADLPIMEDVDLVRRARRHGRLHASRIAATTSARRWEQQGWAGRTAVNVGLILLYAVGVRPATLVRLDRARQL